MEKTSDEYLVIDGITYDITKATPGEMVMINNLKIIQQEINSNKIKMDVAIIAKNSIVNNLLNMIDSPESGITIIQQTEQEGN